MARRTAAAQEEDCWIELAQTSLNTKQRFHHRHSISTSQKDTHTRAHTASLLQISIRQIHLRKQQLFVNTVGMSVVSPAVANRYFRLSKLLFFRG